MTALLLALALARDVVFVDAGARPIYSLRVGHARSGSWTDDLLGFAGVVDVSSGREVRVPVDDRDCLLDIRATFDDGNAVVLTDVDLCHTPVVRIPGP